MEEKVKNLSKAIVAELPQIPFIIDQVSEAINWCSEAHDAGSVVRYLETALDVAKFVREISDPNFYKTHLVIAALIADIPNVLEDERFEIFKSASCSVENSIKKVTVNQELIKDRGCFNALNIHLTQLAKQDENCFTVMLFGILHDLQDLTRGLKEANVKSPVTPQDYITALGYAYVMSNLRMANLPLLDRTKVVVNNIQIILNYDITY